MRLVRNFLGGTISADITDVATSISSDAFASLPAVASPDTMTLVLDPDGLIGAPEVVVVTAHTALSTSVTVTRGAESTTARAHETPMTWVHGITATDARSGVRHIQTITLGADASAITFSSIPALWTNLWITGRVRSTRAGSVTDDMLLRVGSGTLDTGSNYRWLSKTEGDSPTTSGSGSDTSISLGTNSLTGATADTNSFSSIDVEIAGYADTTAWRMVTSRCVTLPASATRRLVSGGGAWREAASVINTISFFPSTGPNFLAGSTLSLYGRG